MQHRARDQPQASLPFTLWIFFVDLTIFVLYDFSCVVDICSFYVISWSNVKAQRLFRYKKNIKISQKVIKKNHKSKYIKVHRLFHLSIMCLIFYDYFPFFLFCYWQILQLTGSKRTSNELQHHHLLAMWVGTIFLVNSRVTLELLHLLFVYSFSLFQYISYVRVPCSFVWNIFFNLDDCSYKNNENCRIFVEVMKTVALSSKSLKLSR